MNPNQVAEKQSRATVVGHPPSRTYPLLFSVQLAPLPQLPAIQNTRETS